MFGEDTEVWEHGQQLWRVAHTTSFLRERLISDLKLILFFETFFSQRQSGMISDDVDSLPFVVSFEFIVQIIKFRFAHHVCATCLPVLERQGGGKGVKGDGRC
jgi:hypothetical protein